MKIPFLKDRSNGFQLPRWEVIASSAGALGLAIGSYFAYPKFFNGSSVPHLEEGQSYEDLTRDELYALAQEEDIEGRSGMNKEELIESLRQAR